MRTYMRITICLLSIVWVLALGLLTAWHKIWVPFLDWQEDPKPSLIRERPRPTAGTDGSFRDDFDGSYRVRTDQTDLDHPFHGIFRLDVDWPQIHANDGTVELAGGAFMADIVPAADQTVSLNVRQSRGDDPTSGVVVALFARCEDRNKPYQTGYTFEWDMHDGKQRIWAAGKVLAECDAPGDTDAHTMTFTLDGETLRGSVDGQRRLQAKDTRFETGIVGFGGHGRPCVVFDWFELKRHTQAQAKRQTGPRVEVGGAFEVREDFAVHGDKRKHNSTGFAIGQKSIDELGFGHTPSYIISGSPFRTNVASHRKVKGAYEDIVALADTVMCLIDSKRATECSLRTMAGDVMWHFDRDSTIGVFHAVPNKGSSLLVRVKDPMRPWTGCYCLTYDWQHNQLSLTRHDQAGPPLPGRWPEQIPVKVTVLAEATPDALGSAAELWISAQGSNITGGLDEDTLVTTVDTTYPSGYVGFGARPDSYGVFKWVEMRGGPD